MKPLLARIASIAATISIGAAVLGTAGPSAAQAKDPALRHDIQQDRRGIRQERQDIRKDRRALRNLNRRHDGRLAFHRVNSAGIAAAQRTTLRAHIRNDRREIREDRRDVRGDRRQRRR